jgi:hypothetical protein
LRALTTAYNPQANGIIERVHLVLGDALRTFELQERESDAMDPWSSFLASAAFAIRSTHHTTLGASPGQLVFGRDMLLPIKFKANWAEIKARYHFSGFLGIRAKAYRYHHGKFIGDLE